MNESSRTGSSRREFLGGRRLRRPAEQPAPPEAGDTLRVETRAMACRFAVILDAVDREGLPVASEALDLVHELEAMMSVHRDEGSLVTVNTRAAGESVAVEPALYEVLELACRLGRETDGAFDPAAGPLVALWRRCRQAGGVPPDDEVASARAASRLDDVQLDPRDLRVGFARPGVALDLGGIGKGYALDRIGERLAAGGLDRWLIHGGHSSLLACGPHADGDGWPVGVRNPLFPGERLATIVLSDRAMSTSGSGVQSFRHAGRRYGHLLDPRTGSPAEGMLSVIVLAPTAAEADALSTAFFVAGVESARNWCHNRDGVSALLIPAPRRGRTLEPVVCGIPDQVLFFERLSE